MLPGSKLRVLVVDDDTSMARFLNAHLTRRNFEVNTAASGEEAIRMFRIFDPNLVLLDVAMNGISGIETLERIKQIKPDAAVIMLSAQNDPEIIFRASKLGADDYMSKPFEPKELDLRINKVVDRLRLVSCLAFEDYRPADADRSPDYLSSICARLWNFLPST